MPRDRKHDAHYIAILVGIIAAVVIFCFGAKA